MKPLISHAAVAALGMGVGIALIAFLDRDEKHEVSGDGRIHLPNEKGMRKGRTLLRKNPRHLVSSV